MLKKNSNNLMEIKFNEKELNVLSDLENKLDLLKKLFKTSYLEDIDILINKNNNIKYFSKEYITTNKEEAIKYILNLKNQKNILHHNLVNIADFSTTITKKWCFKYYYIKVFYEYYENNIWFEINKKKESNLYFTLEQLNKILFQLIDVLYYLQLNNISHGNIKPEIILINEILSNLRLLVFFNNNKSNKIESQINNFLSGENIYMSPIIFKNIFKKKNKFEFNKYKSDVFSLGIILLEIALLQNINDIYNYDNGEINNDILENYLLTVEEKFGKEKIFIIILKKLLEIKETSRPDFIEIYNYLNENKLYNNYENNEIKISNNFNINRLELKNKNNNNNNNNENITVFNYKMDDDGNYIETEKPKNYNINSDTIKELDKNSKVLSIKKYKINIDGNKCLVNSQIFDDYLKNDTFNNNKTNNSIIISKDGLNSELEWKNKSINNSSTLNQFDKLISDMNNKKEENIEIIKNKYKEGKEEISNLQKSEVIEIQIDNVKIVEIKDKPNLKNIEDNKSIENIKIKDNKSIENIKIKDNKSIENIEIKEKVINKQEKIIVLENDNINFEDNKLKEINEKDNNKLKENIVLKNNKQEENIEIDNCKLEDNKQEENIDLINNKLEKIITLDNNKQDKNISLEENIITNNNLVEENITENIKFEENIEIQDNKIEEINDDNLIKNNINNIEEEKENSDNKIQVKNNYNKSNKKNKWRKKNKKRKK